MLRSVLPAFFLSLAFPTAVSAQATDREGLSDLGEQMRDPAYQRDMALMLQAMTEVLLDMPVAPLAQAKNFANKECAYGLPPGEIQE